MTQIPSALLEPPAPPAPTGKEPPGSPPDTPFSTVLDDHQARTAVAEGHDRADQSDAPLAAALAALLGGVPLPAGVTRAIAVRLPVGSAVAPPPAARLPASPVGVAIEAPATPAAGAASPMPTGPAVPVAATALPLGPGASARPVAGQPAVEAGARLGVPADAGRALAVETPAAPAVPNAVAAVAHVLRGAATASMPVNPAVAAASAASGPASAPAAGTRSAAASSANGHAAAKPVAGAPATAPATVASPDAATAPATDPAEPAAATPGVGLEHAVETVRLALRAAAERGVSHARISLTPRELGTIEVHLRQTSDGLVARVVAQHAAAAQLLQDGGADLRRQLEQSGLTLLRLDIGASGEQAGRSGRDALANGGTAANGDGGSRRGAPTDDDPLAPLDGTTETTATATLALPNGALVDVLA